MKTIVLTGATGFVGRQIHKALVARGHAVRAVVRSGSAERLSAAAEQSVEVDDLFALGIADWQPVLKNADLVIHSAWFVTPGKYLDAVENIACVEGSLKLFEAAQQAGISHFVGIGTCMEYQPSSQYLDVHAPLGPTTLYAASKLSLLHMLEQRSAGHDMRLSWCRLFYLFGEGEYPQRLVPYLRRQLEQGLVAKLGSGIQQRDFLDVAVAGRMIASLADTGQAGVINICSGQMTTIRQLAEKIAADYGRLDLLEFGTAQLHPSDPLTMVGVCNLERPEWLDHGPGGAA